MEQMIGGGASVELAQKIYDEAKSAFPEIYRNITFEQWITFLVASGLCTVGDAKYVLTPYGRGFLKYIVDRQLTADAEQTLLSLGPLIGSSPLRLRA